MTGRRGFLLISLFAGVLIIDQVTKTLALKLLTPGIPVNVIGDWVRWTLTHNPGGAFGMRLGSPTYYLVSSLLIFGVLLYYIYHNRANLYVAVPLAIVAGGAAGNIIDRLRFGEVVDFIDCDFFDINIWSYSMTRWPIFNVADIAVSCGIIATILLIIIKSRQRSPEQVVGTDESRGNSGAFDEHI